ncbi:uncharacterized protein F4807DRAFT_448929 [Annulohypoxylon truncatum]|uniref:uncharacterized protein n=1 Tax=Annulohypoxylon truncatum TaxID=327061 RepID=UPI002007F2E5|nr:uncharacterized protein F4807DRAFT_448929 [Annulohypoxylon truncatum]KAI1204120.1 hypothetical protein F4807DRAFT_448929 [Annulohypoxylon truncatum]
MHVVQVLEIENNPLDRPGTAALPALTGAWVILEYLANGSIDKFIENAYSQGRRKLPNRLLWRFCLCMIKACIAITYPRNINTNTLVSETVPAGGRAEDEGMTHNDIHVANVMLADVLEDIEHTITPRLKLIDFGRAADFSQARRIPSPSDISSIGEIILSLILLNPFPFGMHASPYSFQADEGSPEIYTHARELTEGWVEEGHEDVPWLDPDLRALVCNLMREDRDNIPSLADLDRIATAAVRDRDAAWYNNEEFEQDDTIKKLWHDIVHWDGGDDGGGGDDGDLEDLDDEDDDEDDYEDDYEDRYLDDFLGGLP